MKNDNLNKVEDIISNFMDYQESTVPLCAAENAISDFCKLPLSGSIQERYIMGNYDNHSFDDNFIGSEYLLPFYQMLQKQCKLLFNAEYSDARTLTGMNCLTTLLMALTKSGEKIMILPPTWGGHMSVPAICDRLGLIQYEAPYDKSCYDLDFKSLNKILEDESIKYILLAPSDIIKPFSIEHINLEGRVLLYDMSQLLGLIACGAIVNPLIHSDNIIMFGGTHKTLPGPASGLILTNNENLYKQIQEEINPKYLRNTQMHQVVCLLFTLLEISEYGKEYMESMVKLANNLGEELSKYQFNVAKVDNKYSFTHQVFVETTESEMQNIYRNGILHRVTLNDKFKQLFNGYGIRFGTQEIARYKWGKQDIENIALIINELRKKHPDVTTIKQLKSRLSPKNIYYTYPSEINTKMGELLFKKKDTIR